MPKRGVKTPRCRKRIVCKEPDVKVFIPQQNDNSEMLIMTVDEYEKMFDSQLGLTESDVSFETSKDPSPFLLSGQVGHQRQYQVNK